jgi:hypothetical protein
MQPASDTRVRIQTLLARCKQAGVRVKLLKLSNREAWRLRHELYPMQQGKQYWSGLFGVPVKIVAEDRWNR